MSIAITGPNRLQLQHNVAGGFTYENTNVRSVTDTIEYGEAALHVGYQKMLYTYAQQGQVNPPKMPFECFELGILYDPGHWYVTTELFNAHDSYIGNTES